MNRLYDILAVFAIAAVCVPLAALAAVCLLLFFAGLAIAMPIAALMGKPIKITWAKK
jgi:hypothetical protein